jgi:excisionase family DNA binding protein
MTTLTVAETAEKLKVSTSTVYDLVRKKQIPHFRIGQKIFFRVDALDNWITTLEVGGMK